MAIEEKRKRKEALLTGKVQVLEMIARGAPFHQVLETLCRCIEQNLDQGLCSILLLDPAGRHLRQGAAPSLPEAYSRAIDGIAIGPKVGSCGTAAFHGKRVIAGDIATDPRWAGFRALALEHGMRACWSAPIFSSQDEVLGTFAIYHRIPYRPETEELELIDTAAQLAGIAIERKRMAERLLFYRQIFHHAHDGIATTDLAGYYREQNPVHRALIGYSDEALAGQTPAIHLGEETFARIFQALESEDVFRGEIRSRTRADDWVDIELTAFVVRDEDGTPLGTAGIKRDIRARKRAESRLKQLAERDYLTGIYNRSMFHRLLEAELARIGRHRRPLSLILFDVDHFKQINDRHGHLVGDRVLMQLAEIVRENIRKADVFARYGGEEFVLLLPDTPPEKAGRLAEKLCLKCRKYCFERVGKVTCSFGVAGFRQVESAEDFIGRADEALYQAKDAGRNQVHTRVDR
ncbi:sensor domain-containing diguanylate cyclase [Methylohalobius crimeensis]|uniref:sensor domain-containing diguanylate cyclase n=1 Tax=Methylohalobius crimeensis TaxID=244365 RepID=UPI0003B3146B|nr:diguanylate cyclase [Methylohalobius crimeensis]